MGVDYYHCEVCNESRYEEYVGSCIECGNRLCTSCLVNDDVNSRYAHSYGHRYDPNNEELMQKLTDDGYDLKDSNGKPYYEEGDIIDDSSIQPKYCPYCSGGTVDREVVLNYLLKKHKLDIQKVWEEIKENKK